MPVFVFLQTQSQRFILALGVVLIAFIGSVDYLTGSEISFSIFYLIPIAILTWFFSRRAGILASTMSAIIWLAADLSAGQEYSSSTIPFWNMIVRFGFFLILTLTLSSLRMAQVRQEELGHFIVHDLRSPLSNVLSALQFLHSLTEDDMDADRLKLVTMSIASCNRLMTLINSLLDLARLESGKMILNIQKTDVGQLLDNAMSQVATLAERRKVSVNRQVSEEIGRVLADEEVTTRVLVNLLSNALTYSPVDSTVLVDAARYQDNMITISVKDQGPGIPAEWKDKVFDKFRQVETRKKGMGVGSGLGLSFCRLAVEAQNGHIWIESEVDKGTTVLFTLPREIEVAAK